MTKMNDGQSSTSLSLFNNLMRNKPNNLIRLACRLKPTKPTRSLITLTCEMIHGGYSSDYNSSQAGRVGLFDFITDSIELIGEAGMFIDQ